MSFWTERHVYFFQRGVRERSIPTPKRCNQDGAWCYTRPKMELVTRRKMGATPETGSKMGKALDTK